jgi:hypothetical protein
VEIIKDKELPDDEPYTKDTLSTSILNIAFVGLWTGKRNSGRADESPNSSTNPDIPISVGRDHK